MAHGFPVPTEVLQHMFPVTLAHEARLEAIALELCDLFHEDALITHDRMHMRRARQGA